MGVERGPRALESIECAPGEPQRQRVRPPLCLRGGMFCGRVESLISVADAQGEGAFVSAPPRLPPIDPVRGQREAQRARVTNPTRATTSDKNWLSIAEAAAIDMAETFWLARRWLSAGRPAM